MIRFYSPAETIGGGTVLDICPRKHKRNDQKALEACRIKESGTREEMLELSAWEHWGSFLLWRSWQDEALLINPG